MEQLIKFKRDHFIRIDMDKEHYYYSFGVPGFEICLEPCAGGFDVGIYDGEKGLLEPRICTNTEGYLESMDAIFGDRKDEDWNKALVIADELLDKYIHDREKLGEILCHLQKEKMKCMFCGCTDDHACPGGCSWVEPNVCSRCKDRVKGNDLISGEEIIALRARAKTITMKDCMAGRMILIEPIDLKGGYCASYSIVESPVGRAPMEVLSVGTRGRPDPADSERIAMAVLGEGYASVESLLPSRKMVHFWKRRK